MPAAVAVPAIVGGATSLAQGIMGHHAASTAAKQQSAAADRAMAVSRGVYNDQMAGMQPYANVGGAANGLMGRLMGAPAGARFASAGPAQAPMSPAMAEAHKPLNITGIDIGTQPAPSLDAYTAALQATAPRMVKMRSPTGEVTAVPAHLVEAFKAKGASTIDAPMGRPMAPNPMARAMAQQ